MPGISLLRHLKTWTAGGSSGVPLHQYWHDSQPPEEVARLIAEWRTVPGFEHRLFDRESAATFIERHAGPRVAACFRGCAVPAMQSDLFRYVAIHARGGIYIDVDDVPGTGSLLEFLRNVPVGLLCRRRNESSTWFCNNACYARKPGHPLFRRVIELACENIEARAGNNVWEVTGPQLFNRLKEPGDAHLLEGFTFAWYDHEMRDYLRSVGKLAYKKGPEDWRRYANEGRSIYV